MAGLHPRLVPSEGLSDAVVIDAHVHLYPPEINADPGSWAKARHESRWAVLATRVRRNGTPVQTFPSLRELIVALDEAGIDRAVLLGWYWERAENCAAQNRFYAACVKQHPDRLAAAVTVQPLAGTAHVDTEFARARDAGFQGVGELSPHSQGYGIDDPALGRALELAGQWQWPVNLHVTAPDARPYPGMVATPLADFAALAGRFPQNDFILAHFGGVVRGWGATSGRAGQSTSSGPNAVGPSAPGGCASPNVYFDSAAGPLSYGHDIWQRFPPGRVIFGSDFPLNSYPALDSVPNLRRLVEEVRTRGGLEPEALAAVLGGTANRWFSVRRAI